MAVQGHPRSFTLVPIENTYVASYYSVIVTLVLAPFRRFCSLYVLPTPPLFHPNVGGVPVDQIAHVVVSKRMGLELFGREIIFEEFQPTYVIMVPKRYRRTDSQTDRRHAIS